MVLRADVVDRALSAAMEGAPDDRGRWPVVYLSPRGAPFDQAMARRFAGCDGITLLCGRFEGVDQRVLDARGVEEVSLGDFVLTGGEIAAWRCWMPAVRLLPGAGQCRSADEKAFPTACWSIRNSPPANLGGARSRRADRRNHARWPDGIRRGRETTAGRPDLRAAHQTRPKGKRG
jgi:tRNA (guanine37-N1)-methyltransferase